MSGSSANSSSLNAWMQTSSYRDLSDLIGGRYGSYTTDRGLRGTQIRCRSLQQLGVIEEHPQGDVALVT
jgi:hypothetical protein